MAGFSQLAGLPEIVRDSQLPATFRWEGQQQFTIHTQGASRRAKQSQEVWAHMGTLGQGGFGSVELQARQSKSKQAGTTTQLRAVKSIRIPEDELKDNREFYVRELEAIVKFSQARYGDLFVKSYGWFACQSVLYIAMEYCELGDLQRYLLKKCQYKRLPEDQAHDIASQILDALARMHEEKFAHRDLKPANILIKSHPPTHPWVVKVADFGISRRDQGTAINATTSVRGTGSFMPPELLGFSNENSRAVDLYAVDMWCYGETLFRILTGDATFKKPADLYGYYFGHVKFPSHVLEEIQLTPQAIEFLRSVLACSPTERLTSELALDHPWMQTDFHGSDASSQISSRRASTSRPLNNPNIPTLENTIVQMEPTEDTEASASWTENFSQMHLENDQELTHLPTTPSQLLVDHFSESEPNSSVSRYSDGTPPTSISGSGGSEPSSPSVNKPSKSSKLANVTGVPEQINHPSASLQAPSTIRDNENTVRRTQDDLSVDDTEASLSWTAAFPDTQTSGSIHQVISADASLSQATIPTVSNMESVYQQPEPQLQQPTPIRPSQEGMFGEEMNTAFKEEMDTAFKVDHQTPQPVLESQSAQFTNDNDLYPWAQTSSDSPDREDSGVAGIPLSPQDTERNIPRTAPVSSGALYTAGHQHQIYDSLLSEQKMEAQRAFKSGDFKLARDIYGSYWANAKLGLGEEHPRTILALAGLVEALDKLGSRYEEEGRCRTLVALREKTLGAADVATIDSKRLLARCLTEQGKYDEAIAFHHDTIKANRVIGDLGGLYESVEALAHTYVRQGSFENAESTFQEHLKIKGNALGHTHESTLESVFQYALDLWNAPGGSEAALKASHLFFQLTDSLERSGELLTRQTRAQLEELRLRSTNGNGASNSNPEPIRPKPSPSPYEGKGNDSYESWIPSNAKPKEKKGKMSRLRGLFS